MRGLIGAVSFLTRVPAGGHEDPALERYVAWFPVVGALVGLVVGGVYAVAGLVWPSLLAATLAIGSGVVVTGAFHEDGLADTFDAFGAWDGQEARRILRDPAHGTYGVAALTLSLLVRIGAVATLGPIEGAAALIVAHTVARGLAVIAMYVVAPAAGEGLGATYAARVTLRDCVQAAAFSVVVAIALLWFWGAAAILLGAVCATALARPAITKVGGITGDLLGAMEQAGECGVLLLCAAIASRSVPLLWWT